MSKQETKEQVIKRINQLNKKIDLKIVLGKDYKKEMKEHENLYLYLKCEL